MPTSGYESADEARRTGFQCSWDRFLARFHRSSEPHCEHCLNQPKAHCAVFGNTDMDHEWLKLASEADQKVVGHCAADNAEKTAFSGGMQSLCCLSGVQRSLEIALPQRLPGGLAHDVGVSCQQHQRDEVAPQREHCDAPRKRAGRLDRRPGCEDRPSYAALDKEEHLAQTVNGLL